MSRSLTLSARRRTPPASSTRIRGRVRAQLLDDRVADLAARCRAAGAGAARSGAPAANACQDGLLELRPEALDAAQLLPRPPRAGLERVDPSSSNSSAGALGSEARQARDVDQPGRELGAQLLGGRDRRPCSSSAMIFSSSVLPIRAAR